MPSGDYPEGDTDFPMRWPLIKPSFSRRLEKTELIRDSRVKKRERGIWQRCYWEHQIKDHCDFERHVDYIHYNPVKHGMVKQPIDWPFSTLHRFVQTGDLLGFVTSAQPTVLKPLFLAKTLIRQPRFLPRTKP